MYRSTSWFVTKGSSCTRCGLAVGVALALLLVISGCGGGGGARDGVAAEVNGKTVSTASLEHWIPIEAVISRESVPTHPVPPGEVPDPPRYTNCIAYERHVAATTPGESLVLSAKQLKAQCRERYKAVREHMLQILISFQWLEAEAATMGVEVSNDEVQQAWDRFKAEALGGDPGLKKYLKYTGATLQDELLVVKMDQLSLKLQKKVIAERGISGARKYYEAFPRRWAAKTSCSKGYVIPECKQYKGPKPPEPSI